MDIGYGEKALMTKGENCKDRISGICMGWRRGYDDSVYNS
jgi:hypothetical protein